MANGLETYFSGNDDGNSRSETIVIINCVLNVPLMLISIISNTLVLAAILITPSLRSPSTILLCSLVVSDILVGLVVQPNYIAAYLLKNFSLQKAASRMALVAGGVSLPTMTAIAVDRFMALHYHMRYPSLMTSSRAKSLSATLWMVVILLSLLTIFKEDAFPVTAAVSTAICLLTCSVCYIRIYHIVRHHQLQIQVQQQAVASIDTENYSNIQKSTKSAKSTFIYFIVMILCYIPLFINMSTFAVSPDQWTIEWTLTETLALMNSSINPFLYTLGTCEVKNAGLIASLVSGRALQIIIQISKWRPLYLWKLLSKK